MVEHCLSEETSMKIQHGYDNVRFAALESLLVRPALTDGAMLAGIKSTETQRA